MPSESSSLTKFFPALTVVVVIVIAVVAYLLLFAPKIALLSSGGRYDLGELRTVLKEDSAYIARMESAIEDYRMLNSQRRQKIESIVPVNVDVPGIMATVDAIVRKNKMVLTSIDVTLLEDEIGKAGQLTARVSANIEGGDYESFKLLLSDLERSRRLFDVSAMVITPSSAKYSIQLNAYYFSEDILNDPASLEVSDGPPPQSMF